jgi:hypothetical protein
MMVTTNEPPWLDGWNFVTQTKSYLQILYFFIYVDNHEHGKSGKIHGSIPQIERRRHYHFCTPYHTHWSIHLKEKMIITSSFEDV